MAASTALLAPLHPAFSESVSVNRGEGQGLIVTHRGNCYLLIPDHVRGRSSRLSLSLGAPLVGGEATVFQSFAPGTDLAVAYVRGDLQGRCREDYADLDRPVDTILDGATRASLVRVQTSGQITRTPVAITEILYDTLRIRVEDDEAPLYQGTSGSFLFVDDIPIAMMIEAPDPMTGIALRADAIADRTRRLLSGRSPREDVAAPPLRSDGNGPDAAEGLPIADIGCSAEPVSPEAACSNILTGSGPLLLPPLGRPLEIEIELETPGEKAVVVSRIELASQPDDASSSPKAVRIELDSSQGTQRRWRTFGAGDMSPLGELSIGSGGGQFARRLRISIDNAWRPDLPVRLDRVVVR
ncbi:hypothetical protein MIC97_20510 [Aquamicrobium sp. NLF2-7]|uniref:hypothetical protein n=1 Tax=Aquamicrobium sp. NLF2-7 TaxID=2918753 RepID=UPI001EFABF66|nr:hypothetical protein [Aquamicrobium sp. NLF2-7]MCG8273870.1 hypothetical protein [Aquamicrobium sp. NLF2-7]